MPYALLLIGAVMLVAGVRNTYGDLWTLIKGDFTQQGGFINWVAAIAVVGGLGYIPRLRPLSVAFMTLLLLVLVISHNGVFAQLQQFLQSGAGGANSGTIPNGSEGESGSKGGTGPINAQTVSSAAEIAANLGALA